MKHLWLHAAAAALWLIQPIQGQNTETPRSVNAVNLPYFWLEKLRQDELENRHFYIDESQDCGKRAKEYARIAQRRSITLPSDSKVRLMMSGRIERDLGKIAVQRTMYHLGLQVSDKGLPIYVISVPSSNNLLWLSRINGQHNIGRPGFIERIYFDSLYGRCLSPMSFKNRDLRKGKDYVQQNFAFELPMAPPNRVYLSPEMPLPALRLDSGQLPTIDHRAPLSESAAIVNNHGTVTSIVCFISDNLTGKFLIDAFNRCFDIVEIGINGKQAKLRRYFDE